MERARNGRLAQSVAALAELRLQVVERHFEFRECNYSLYPSWLAYPWPHAHLRISGSGPYALERRARQPGRADDEAAPQTGDAYVELADAAAVGAVLLEFAATAPQAAKTLLNLNPGTATRSVSGQLFVFGRRVASLGSGGDLNTLPGIRFIPALEVDGARAGGARGRILIHPGTRLEYAVPAALARRAQARLRPGLRVERIELLPSVFVDAAAFRSLWPELPEARAGARYRLLEAGAPGEPGLRPRALQAPSGRPLPEPLETAVAD